MPCYIPVSRRRWWLWVSFSTWFQHSCRPSNLLFWCHLDFRTLCNKKWNESGKWWSQGAFQQIYPPQNYHIHVCISISISEQATFQDIFYINTFPLPNPLSNLALISGFASKPKAAATCQRGGESEWWNAWFARQIVERQRSLGCWWWEWFGWGVGGWKLCLFFLERGRGWGLWGLEGMANNTLRCCVGGVFFSAEMRQWRYWLVIFEDICWVEDMMRWKPSSRHQFNVIPWTLIARSMVLHVVPLFCFARPFLDFFWSPKALRFWLSIEV